MLCLSILPDYLLVLSLLKSREIGVFWNKKKIQSVRSYVNYVGTYVNIKLANSLTKHTLLVIG